jgi:small subunit ribosomal protein S8
MSMTDPIADMLTRIRNANNAGLPEAMMPASKVKAAIAEVLKKEGFILGYSVIEDSTQGMIKIALKYDKERQRVIEGIKRISTPGRRVYAHKDKIPRTRGGLGMTLVSTSRGIMSDVDARNMGIGGELICSIW